jgi:hypothetical protein
MPQYHFVIDVTDHTYDDPDGAPFPSEGAATDFGRQLVCELKEGGFEAGAVLHITDESGQTVHSIPFWAVL